MYCDFQQIEPGVYRCQNKGCTITLRNVTNPARIRASRCLGVGSTTLWYPLTEDGRNPVKYPCKHLGDLLGEQVKGCGCHVPPWQKELYECEMFAECILIQLKKKPSQRNCQTCSKYEAKEVQLE